MIYEPAFADAARDLCRLGATDEELAEHFEVCVRTIYRWRNAHEDFAKAVVTGKEHADARVERALYSRAVGCAVERTRVFKHAGDPDPVYATYTDHLPPDVNAALQWLRTRQRAKWGTHQKELEDDNSASVGALQRALARLEATRTAARDAALAGQAQEAAVPTASATLASEAATPEPERDGASDPDVDPCAQREGEAGAGSAPQASASDPAPAAGRPTEPPPRPIPPGFPLERVRFGYG